MTLTLALSQGGREEIERAIKQLAVKVKNNIISPEKIDQFIINEHLYTRNLPDVDLLIRTSGEKRISNFLLWQIAYAELYFSKVLWPDFRKKHLHKAIINYQKRERRFGKTSEQLLQQVFHSSRFISNFHIVFELFINSSTRSQWICKGQNLYH